MIIGDRLDFFVQLDVVMKDEEEHWVWGIFNFWIDDIPYPGKGRDITFNVAPYHLVCDYEDMLNYQYDGSNLPLEQIDFQNENHLFDRTAGELENYGLRTKFEIVGDTLRFFYSQNGGAWQLKEIPLAYYESIIKKLDELCKENFKSLLDDRFNNN